MARHSGWARTRLCWSLLIGTKRRMRFGTAYCTESDTWRFTARTVHIWKARRLTPTRDTRSRTRIISLAYISSPRITRRSLGSGPDTEIREVDLAFGRNAIDRQDAPHPVVPPQRRDWVRRVRAPTSPRPPSGSTGNRSPPA